MLENEGVTQADIPQGNVGSDVPPPQTASERDADILNAYLAQEEQQAIVDGDDSLKTAEQESNQQRSDVFTVKIDGEEKQVTRDELIANYSKSNAADKRFNEAAEIRKASEAKIQAAESEQAKLQNALNYFTQIVQQWDLAGLLSPPNVALLDSDPVTYIKQQREYESRVAEIEKAQAAQAYLNQQSQQQQQERLKAHLSQESQRLPELLPEWKNSEIRAKETKEVTQYLLNQGYSHEDIEGLNVSRASNIALVIKAMRYDNLVQKAKSGVNRVQNMPQRVERPTGNNAPGVDAVQASKAKLMKSGSMNDAADYFSQLFGQ